METGLFRSEGQALAAASLRELFKRVETACNNLPLYPDIPQDGALRALEQLPRLRAAMVKTARPTWRYLYEIVMLCEAFPPSRTERRLNNRFFFASQRRNAKQPRPKSLFQQLKNTGAQNYSELRIKAPELVKAHSKQSLVEALSRIKAGKKKLQ